VSGEICPGCGEMLVSGNRCTRCTNRRWQTLVRYAKGLSETTYQQRALIDRLCRRVARWKLVATEYKQRLLYMRNAATEVSLIRDAVVRERDALRQRVTELEARYQPDCCDDPADRVRPGLRVRATSVPEGRMR
jgi:hypothetical protein